MKYVYLLQSISHPNKRYIGITKDLNKRLKNHNAGQSPHTSKYKPWEIVVAVYFEDDYKAEQKDISNPAPVMPSQNDIYGRYYDFCELRLGRPFTIRVHNYNNR